MNSKITENLTKEAKKGFPLAMEHVCANPDKCGLVVLFLSENEGIAIHRSHLSPIVLFELKTTWTSCFDSKTWAPFKGKIELEF